MVHGADFGQKIYRMRKGVVVRLLRLWTIRWFSHSIFIVPPCLPTKS